MCGFVTPLQGPEADEHRKPEVAETEDHRPPASPPSLPLLSVTPRPGREGLAQTRIGRGGGTTRWC